MTDVDWIDLSDVIDKLRSQLSEARATAVGQDVTFAVGAVTVELAVEARREGGVGGGVRFGVVTLEGKGGISSGSTHKVTLQLLPHDATGASFDVEGLVSEPPSR